MSWFKSKMLGLVATIGLSGGVASAQEVSQDDNVGDKNKQTEMVSTPKKQSVDAYDFTQEQSDSNRQRIWDSVNSNPSARKKFLATYDNYFNTHKDSIMAARWQKFEEAKEYIANLVAQFEDFRAFAYWDPHGKCWTVGYGNTVMPDGSRVTAATVIRSPEEGKSMLLQHVEKDAAKILEVIPIECAKDPQEVAAIFSGCYNFGTGPFVGKAGKRTALAEDATVFFLLRTKGAKDAFDKRYESHCKSGGKTLIVLSERRRFESGLWGYYQGDKFIMNKVPLEQLAYSRLGSVYAAKGDPSLMASICQNRYCEEGGMCRAVNEQLSQPRFAAKSKVSTMRKKYTQRAKSTQKSKTGTKSKMRTQARGGRGGR